MKTLPFNSFPILATERLLLRSFQLSDAPSIYELRTDKAVMKYMDSDDHASQEESERFVQNNINAYEKGDGVFWVIEDKVSKQFIGDVSFWKLDKHNSRGEIGYILLPAFWGKGLMHEALQAVLHFGFDAMDLHSVEANINPENEPSRKLLLKLGFVKEAYFRENYFYNGHYLDSEIYSLLAGDLMSF
ncbi:GNAT family N-acetyltransferase [Fulvivirga ligni]|uniref:GNAT family N-acetyltransferase n=1 Tax=Fulvivirga ligni TaxID=2904246 RepID=UPI001F2D279B|nr:GNAT family N-acetyltransferase [Fulvivirga ligni]UII20228.1 GNAT family N-acetyltransferase [Fulvivirga ligni]